jgi:aspartyl-tRNA(Asn)/glutamyl-tRNA(Gln) amidotransferase subunit C
VLTLDEMDKNTVTDDVVRYVAQLSRLSLDGEEEAMFRQQLQGILGYIEQLKKVDTDNTPPTTHVLPSMKNIFREDEPAPSLLTSEALANAPARKGDFFKVPRIIKDQ